MAFTISKKHSPCSMHVVVQRIENRERHGTTILAEIFFYYIQEKFHQENLITKNFQPSGISYLIVTTSKKINSHDFFYTTNPEIQSLQIFLLLQ